MNRKKIHFTSASLKHKQHGDNWDVVRKDEHVKQVRMKEHHQSTVNNTWKVVGRAAVLPSSWTIVSQALSILGHLGSTFTLPDFVSGCFSTTFWCMSGCSPASHNQPTSRSCLCSIWLTLWQITGKCVPRFWKVFLELLETNPLWSNWFKLSF